MDGATRHILCLGGQSCWHNNVLAHLGDCLVVQFLLDFLSRRGFDEFIMPVEVSSQEIQSRIYIAKTKEKDHSRLDILV